MDKSFVLIFIALFAHSKFTSILCKIIGIIGTLSSEPNSSLVTFYNKISTTIHVSSFMKYIDKSIVKIAVLNPGESQSYYLYSENPFIVYCSQMFFLSSSTGNLSIVISPQYIQYTCRSVCWIIGTSNQTITFS